MSGECNLCSEHCLECKCSNKTTHTWELKFTGCAYEEMDYLKQLVHHQDAFSAIDQAKNAIRGRRKYGSQEHEEDFLERLWKILSRATYET